MSVPPAQRAPVLRLLCAAALCAAAAACGPSAPARAPRAPAARIVSLAPAFTETLIALGAEDRIVGIGRFDPDVPGRPGLPRLGDSFGVDLESVLALRPDAVLVNSRILADALAPAGDRLRVVELPTDRLDDAFAAIAEVGRLAGRDREAAALASRMRAALDAVRARPRVGAPPKVLVVVQRRPLFVAGRGSYVDDLLRAVGAENAFGDLPQAWPSVGEESVVARAPDVILDASVGDVDTAEGREALRAEWSRFPTVPAVRRGAVHVVREDALFRPGPRIPEALDVLERLVHGAGGGGR